VSSNQQILLGEGAGGEPAVFIEDVFSTYLYTGNGSTQTITNNIDLSTKSGLVWLKIRTSSGSRHQLTDTVRGATKYLQSDIDYAEGVAATGLTSFSSTGFALGANADYNVSSGSFVSWTFRKQPKFFDVVTYTGTGSNTTIAHTLGSVPGCIIVKRTDTAADWAVYHRSLANTEYLVLNSTAAKATGATWWNSTTPTSAVFSVGTNASVNASGGTYVAYIYAHDAGGFGLAGTDNVISCGSYTGNGSATGPIVTLGYEPQWVLSKVATTVTTQNWLITDTARGFTVSTDNDPQLFANLSSAETLANRFNPNATGFDVVSANSEVNSSGETYIYIAIRRGPMKVPTVGTSVFSPVTYTGTGATQSVTAGFPVDLSITGARSQAAGESFYDRLRGATILLIPWATSAESTKSDALTSFASNTQITLGADTTTLSVNNSGSTYVDWMFGRAPGFFDEVCYTGDGIAGRTITHNLAAVPELMIVKRRSSGIAWFVYDATNGATKNLVLNTTAASVVDSLPWNDTAPTSSVFSVGGVAYTNNSGATFVAYLFATCAGVSKVGTYTGNGSSQTIACGFSAGSRFVLIKRTDSTGDWYVWDSARGIVAGNDPHLSLNDTAAEVTTDDSVDTDNSGFIVNQLSATNVNVTSATYIFLAIA